jgi:hypothetical protein
VTVSGGGAFHTCRMELLVDSAFGRWPGLGASKPAVAEVDYETCVELLSQSSPVSTSAVHTELSQCILPRHHPPLGSRLSLCDARAALFHDVPFKDPFQLSMLEVLVDYVHLFHETISCCYLGPQSDTWYRFWCYFWPSARPSKSGYWEGVPAGLDVAWDDRLDVPVDPRSFQLVKEGTGIWIRRIDWNKAAECLSLLHVLCGSFETVKLVMSPQSNFPIPHAYVLATGRRYTHGECRSDTRLHFLKFVQRVHRIIHRSEDRMEWIALHRDHPESCAFGSSSPEFVNRGQALMARWTQHAQGRGDESPTYCPTSPVDMDGDAY